MALVTDPVRDDGRTLSQEPTRGRSRDALGRRSRLRRLLAEEGILLPGSRRAIRRHGQGTLRGVPGGEGNVRQGVRRARVRFARRVRERPGGTLELHRGVPARHLRLLVGGSRSHEDDGRG